jgi:hypothetical protein
VFPKKLLPGERGAYQAGKRVPYIGSPHPVTGEKLLFKGEDAQQALDGAAHFANAALPPGPSLGGNQVDHRNPLVMKLTSHTQVKIG